MTLRRSCFTLKGELIYLTMVFPSRNSGLFANSFLEDTREDFSPIHVQAQLVYRHIPAAREQTAAVLESSGGFGNSSPPPPASAEWYRWFSSSESSIYSYCITYPLQPWACSVIKVLTPKTTANTASGCWVSARYSSSTIGWIL